jgi:hypothetical protein
MSTREVIEMLVATNADAITKQDIVSNPNRAEKPYPIMKGTITPTVPVMNEAEPTVLNSLKVISNPATNKMSIPPISPNARTKSLYCITGDPPMAIIDPNAYGPNKMPAKSSPNTEGNFTLEKSWPKTFAEKTRMQMLRIALNTGSNVNF